MRIPVFGFGNALCDARDGADFSAEPHFARHAHVAFDGGVDIAGKHRSNDREVDGGVGHSDAAGDIEEDVFLGQLETDAFFQHGQQHIEAAEVETGG